MAIKPGKITVGTTAVELTTAPSDRIGGMSIVVRAPAASDLFVGDDDVTAATGWKIPAGATFAIDLQPREQLWGVLASGSGVADVLRAGV